MANPVSSLSATLLTLNEPPTEKLKERCWDAFVATNPSNDNKSEFRALLDRVTIAPDMRNVRIILCTATLFHSTYRDFVGTAGSQEGKRMLEAAIVEAVPELCEDVSDEGHQRCYEEAFPFSHIAQGVLYGMLYEFNNRSGCRRRNTQTSSSRQ